MSGAKKLMVDPNGNGLPTVSSETAVNQVLNMGWPELVFLPNVSAPGTALHAQYAGGAALNDVAGPWTMQYPARTVRVVLGVGGANPVSIVVHGHVLGQDESSEEVVDTIVCAGAGTYEGTVAFTSITRVTSSVDPVGTVDLQTGNGFAFAYLGDQNTRYLTGVSSVISVNGVRENATSIDENTGTVIPATAPNGSRTYGVVVGIGMDHTHLQNAHTHTVT